MITFKEARDAKGHGSDKHHAMVFGRMNPVTSGHEAVVKKMHDVAKEHGAGHSLIVSHSQDAKKNPLSADQKVTHAKNAFPGTNVSSSSKEKPTILHHAAELHKQGVTHLHVVAGSDRHKDMHDLLHKYNGQDSGHGHYNFKKITVHSSGERDPDAEGTEGMSASKMREHAASGNKAEFHKGTPSSMKPEHKDAMYNDVRKGMGIKEELKTYKELMEDSYISKLISRHRRGENLAANEKELVTSHLKRSKIYGKSKNAISSEFKEELEESVSELNKHISDFSKGVKSSSAKQSTYKRDNKAIHNMKHVETDSDHQAVFKHLQKMGYKKTSGYDSKPNEFDMHHNREEMTSKSDPVHHSSGVSAHVEKEHGGKTKVHFTHRHIKEEVEQIDELSTDLLARYKKAAGADAKAADASGNYAKGDKRFKGINKATNKQFDNDLKKHNQVKEETLDQQADRVKQLKKFKDMMAGMKLDEVKTGNPGYGYHGQHQTTHNGDEAYEKIHAHVKSLTDSDDKTVKHYLDSAHGRHLVGHEDDHEHIKKDFKKFSKYYRPAMHEEVVQPIEEELDDQLRSLEEAAKAIDQGEYDFEGQMARTQLQTILRNSKDLIDMLSDEENMPEWVQSKITLAQDYITTVRDYLQSREELDEKAPPGFEGTVKAMKKHPEIDNPYALSWYLKNKGAKSHRKADGSIKEESLDEGHYEDSEGHLDKADKAQRNKDMFSHHMHMADHHDSLSQWHDSKGRSSAAEKHAMKAADHEELAHAMKNKSVSEGTLQPSGTDKIETAGSPVSDIGTQKLKVTKVKSFKFFTAEHVQPIQEASVKSEKHSWGKMMTVHHGASHSYPLHPEHQEAIRNLKHGEKTSFKDETGAKVNVHRDVQDVHFTSNKTATKTTVPHSHFSEENELDEKLIGKQKNIDKNKNGKIDAQDFKILQKENAPVAPVPDKKYIKGTPENKALKASRKPINGMPTNVKEEAKKEDPPFDGPYKSTFKKPNNPSRSGMDAARALAQRAMGKVKEKAIKEDNEQLDEVNHRDFASQGKMHPDMAKHMKTGQEMDFYHSKTGDKISGIVKHNSGSEVHVKAHKDGKVGAGEVHKFNVTSKLDETAPLKKIDHVNLPGEAPHEEKWEPAKKKMVKKESLSFSDFLSRIDEIKMADLPSRKVQGRSYGADYEDPAGAFETKDDMKKAEPKKAGRKVGQKVGARANLGNSKLHQA